MKMMSGRLILTMAILFSSVGFTEETQEKIISLMTYNTENLFDTEHDEGKTDYTYLPLAVKKASPKIMKYCKSMSNSYYRRDCLTMDWNQETLDRKINQIAKVILSYDNGNGPDIIVLEEVENINALRQLKNKGLRGHGYIEAVLIEGPDNRGIDVGIISRFKLDGEAKLNKVDLSVIERGSGRFSPNTRGILQATFKVGKNRLTVFGNHWSSQANIDQARVVAAQTLYEAALKVEDSAVVATGDFNTLEDDNPNGINLFLLNEDQEDSFYDAQDPTKDLFSLSTLTGGEEGSHWYRGEWTYLDKIFLLKSTTLRGPGRTCGISRCIRPVWDSFKVHKPHFAVHDLRYIDRQTGQEVVHRGVPLRFDAKTGEGFSDHLPVVIKLKFQ